MLIWFQLMSGFLSFFIAFFLSLVSLGFLAVAAGQPAWAQSTGDPCSVPSTDNVPKTCTGTSNGQTFQGTEYFQCQPTKKLYSDGTCYGGVGQCSGPSCPPSSGTTKPPTTPTPNTAGKGELSACGSTFIISGIGDFLGASNQKCAIIEKAKWSEQGIFEGIGEAAFGDSKKNLTLLRGPDGKLDYSRVSASELDTGVMGMLGTFTTQMIDNPPAIRTGSYFADLAPFKTVNAAGIDSISPSPIKAFWTAMRNISYGLFVLILVAIGFMVMFRSKLDPRTTVTVTAALPNLVVSLVLITFSLVLAGLIIDLGAILIELVKNVLVNQNLIAENTKYVSTRPLDVLTNFAVRIYDTPLGTNFENIPIIGGLGKGLFTAIIATVALFISFNIFFTLLFKWAAIMIKTIFAPLFFLWGALPGQGDTTTKWFKGFLSDVLTFPAVLLILNIANQIISTPASQGMAFPPALGGTGEAGSGNYLPLVGLGVLLLATKVPAMIEEALDVKASGHVAKAGTDVQKAASKTPLLGRFFGS